MTDEYGWVIEREGGDKPLLYWAGAGVWSTQHLDAIRFVRRLDAERVARYLPEHPHYRVVEHAWYGPEAP